MIQKSIDAITKSDIEALLANGVAEGRTLDYKLTLPGSSDEDKREFLADVSSFANSVGGDLVFGVAEANGVPTDIVGLANSDLDAVKLRLDQMVRDSLAPRIIGIRMTTVAGFANGPVLVLRVPYSFASPHMVTFKNSSRFFTRNNAGKYQMDVGELRSAFSASESVGERLQRFRTERVSKIVGGETPVPMSISKAKLILHVVPFSAFSLDRYIGGKLQRNMQAGLPPIGAGGWNHRHNLEGFVTYGGMRAPDDGCRSYCQLFRTGAVEAVWADLLRDVDGQQVIASSAHERYLIESLGQYLKTLDELGVSLPLLVVLTMTGVKGAELFVGPYFDTDGITAIDRDALLLPDVVVDRYDVDVAALLRPIFDAVWNAAGYARSFNYNESGEWKPAR